LRHCWLQLPVPPSDITSAVSSGQLKALIDLRDSDLPALQTQLDELAYKLKTELNQVHNQGSGFPPPPSLTGEFFVTGDTDISNATGIFVIGVVDEDGIQQEVQMFDLSTPYADVNALVTAIDGMTNLSASVNSDGHLLLSAGSDYRVTVPEWLLKHLLHPGLPG